jgi:predicted RNase H-like HicB family nuclease
MEVSFLLDTNVLVYHVAGEPAATKFLEETLARRCFCLSILSVIEFLGWHGHTDEEFAECKGLIELATMELNITIELRKKANWYLARTPELDFISQGRTREEAKGNLLEVTRIQFAEMKETGTLEDYLAECGFETKENDIIPRAEIVEFEKSVVSV